MGSPLPLNADIISEIRQAVKDCKEYHLPEAAKWASDILLSVDPESRATPHSLANNFSSSSSWQRPPPRTQTQLDALKLAKIFMENRHYLRVKAVLTGPISSGCLKSTYFLLYSQFLGAEVHRVFPWQDIEKANNGAEGYNTRILSLLNQIPQEPDPWLQYLKGLMLSRLGKREEGIECCILSLASYPWNWSTWTLLSSSIRDGEELQAILSLLPLPREHPLVWMFQIKTSNDLRVPSDHELDLCDQLLCSNYFPESTWLLAQRACALYYLHKFQDSEYTFDILLKKDPFTTEHLDLYSNILYVTGASIKLSKIAHEYAMLEMNRPEVCCLLGNHHSMRAERRQAIQYFRRAIQLDRTFLSAWTLLGHEYVELKDPQAAITAYRNAIAIDRRDYRPWYGLGQLYELLLMRQYALYYYQHATAAKPYDLRLWNAEAGCYRAMGKYRDSIECLKRALISTSPSSEDQISIILKLADLHQLLGDKAESAAHHQRIIYICTTADKSVESFAFSCLQVAEYEMSKTVGDLEIAHHYCFEVSKTNAEESLRAADMLREIEKLKRAREANAAGQAASGETESDFTPVVATTREDVFMGDTELDTVTSVGNISMS
ncbi:hypothetical protein DL96DRAFT_1601410 [Flagelloscypha sp. PMI_526]|nr:hypothetical protein DL96DRAFT_1601410 [Flagelloscypha sp. PMI_526]